LEGWWCDLVAPDLLAGVGGAAHRKAVGYAATDASGNWLKMALISSRLVAVETS